MEAGRCDPVPGPQAEVRINDLSLPGRDERPRPGNAEAHEPAKPPQLAHGLVSRTRDFELVEELVDVHSGHHPGFVARQDGDDPLRPPGHASLRPDRTSPATWRCA